MKKRIALLLAFCFLLPCAGLCEEPASVTNTAEESDEENPAPALYQVRKSFEESLLPQLFYEDLDLFLDHIERDGIFDLWTSYTESGGFDVVYHKDEFSQTQIQKEDGTRIMLVTLPVPEDTSLCSRMYFCLNQNDGKKGCFTVEYDNLFDAQWFLCGWTADGVHMSYSTAAALPDPADPGYQAALDAEIDAVLAILNSDIQPEESSDSSAGSGS